jgi:spore maturation protein A
MNIVFTAVILISAVVMFFVNPSAFLPALLDGAEKSVKMAVTLFCIYAVWMGLSAVSETSGANGKTAKLLTPMCKKVFKTNDEEAAQNLAMNLSCNLLGLGGAATPFAVKAIRKLNQTGNDYAQKFLFVLNATSVQVIPTTVIALRAANGSTHAADIVLPSFLSSLACTALALAVYILSERPWKK